jgi:sugar/nucleoside kinase (ribokinase family)
MKFLVIGHSVEDHIISGNDEIIKPGGIYYTASALTSVTVNDTVYLCTSAEKENYNLFSDVFDLCKPDFIQYTGTIPKVLLTIHGEKERDEQYNNINRSLDLPPYERLNEFDGILINMITGFDIELEQLKKIRQNFTGTIYLDVHTLSRGLGHHGHRDFRHIYNFKEWAECVDIIQANEYEIKTLSSEISDNDIALEILGCGTKQIIITKGPLGAKVYYLHNGELNSIFKSAAKVISGNKIGLGDVFGAVYFYNYIKIGDLFSSLENSVAASGLAAEQNGLTKLKKI